MKITAVRLYTMDVPLRVPFRTALRTVNAVSDIVVKVETDTDAAGWGEAPPTAVITGDTKGAIIGAIRDQIAPAITGMEVDALEPLLLKIQSCIVHNTSAKAAVDMAVYDLYGQLLNVPVYKMLGAARSEIVTDITISVNDPDVMAKDAINAKERGYDTLKVKVGVNPDLDTARLFAVRQAVGEDLRIRIDANQAWTPHQALRILDAMQEKGLNLELVEQPVKAADLAGLAEVTKNSPVPVLADEAVFSPQDAVKIMQMHAADMVNIKLMKCGGIYNALQIAEAARVYGCECMLGCMLEAKISVNAAVELACAKSVITRIDLDGPVLCSEDPVIGGAVFDEKRIRVSNAPGLGIQGVREGYLKEI
ncbi:MAG TPA: dipeptide epimerase [Lachnospiraceae bacterium]|jgi:L-alanine-DL-glutamate epimerase-like enolase superfamily enzyme|nr:dipeptide epimerase [Lachnospiraceae bacterium]